MANEQHKCDIVKVGMRFNMLTVLSEDFEAEKLSKYSHKQFKCVCDCGNIKTVDVYDLIDGRVKSCGDKKHRGELLKGMSTHDLTGQNFGNLSVIKQDLSKETGKGKHAYWICECNLCGKQKSIRSSDLVGGIVVDCGCGRSKRISDAISKDYNNQVFGHLKVIEKDLSKIKSGTHTYWICECDICGRVESVSSDMLGRYGKDRCKICMGVSNGEQKIVELLEDNNISFIHDKPYKNFKYSVSGGTPRFDFRITQKSECDYIIEYDGEQHYKDIPNYQGLEYHQIRDNEKNQFCKDNGIPIIRIPYKKLKTLVIEDLLLETTDFLVG